MPGVSTLNRPLFFLRKRNHRPREVVWSAQPCLGRHSFSPGRSGSWRSPLSSSCPPCHSLCLSRGNSSRSGLTCSPRLGENGARCSRLQRDGEACLPPPDPQGFSLATSVPVDSSKAHGVSRQLSLKIPLCPRKKARKGGHHYCLPSRTGEIQVGIRTFSKQKSDLRMF